MSADQVSTATRRGVVPRPRTPGRQPSREERTARGKAARGRVPRSVMGRWHEPASRPDPVAILEAQARRRLPELVPIRHGRMLASPFAFFRGGAAIMAADLAAAPRTDLRAQLCGDAHVSNFGGYASPDRHLVFDLNDFDETLPGPWEWDVKRLVASLAIAGRHLGLDAAVRRRMVLAAADSYRTAMSEFAGMGNLDVWYARLSSSDVVERWGDEVGPKFMRTFQQRVQKAMTKTSASATSKLARLVDGEHRIVSNPPLVMALADLVDGEERVVFEKSVQSAMRTYGRTLAGDRRALLSQYRYVDMARKVVGVGSVGTRAWVVLLRGVDGGDPLMLQIKEARESVLAPFAGASRYANQGQRVVEGQRLMQASSDIFLGWHRGVGVDGTTRDFYVRQLWDWKVSTDVERATASSLTIIGKMCGWTLARAHARSGDRVATAAYLGRSTSFDQAMAGFAEAYADQTERDYRLFADAVATGRLEALIPEG
jgi:uncharacterized protein (DUF2252 family)